jgi:glycine C-acetyltransferase
VTPIIPVMIGDEGQAAFGRKLRALGIYAQAFSSPVVPQGKGRIRCIVSASQSQDDLDTALEAFANIGPRLRLI